MSQRQAKSSVAKKPASAKSTGASGFAARFFESVPKADTKSWSPAALNEIASFMKGLSAKRQKGKPEIKITNSTDGKRANAHGTVIGVVNDDMPFLVDSIAAELIYRKLAIETLFHPIMTLADGRTESNVFIRLEHTLGDSEIKDLTDTLADILDDVRRATSQWRQMLKVVDEVKRTAVLNPGRAYAKADIEEAAALLDYLSANNFTFIGYAYYNCRQGTNEWHVEKEKSSALGVMAKNHYLMIDPATGEPDASRASVHAEAVAIAKMPVAVTKLIDVRSTVHRRVPFDVVHVPVFSTKGVLQGFHAFVGLFTSSTYSCRTSEVPVVRRLVRDTLARANFKPASHDAKALEHILEKFPRDELFQYDVKSLYETALGILRLQERHRIALFTRTDLLGRYISCLVYVPRDIYDTTYRMLAEKLLTETFDATGISTYVSLDDSPQARVRFQVRVTDSAKLDNFDHAQLESRLIAIGQDWSEGLKSSLISGLGKAEGARLHHVYGNAFPTAYQETVQAENAIHDIRMIETLVSPDIAIAVEIYRLHNAPDNQVRLKVYHEASPVPLSTILPVLENMGLRSISETPHEVRPRGGFAQSVWVHDFVLEVPAGMTIDLAAVKQNFEAAFIAVWRKVAEDDPLNQLTLTANFAWRDVVILRAYNAYMRQARTPYSRRHIENVLTSYPGIARDILKIFKAMHDPAQQKTATRTMTAANEAIDAALQNVSKLDHDRVLRKFRELVAHTLRTNFFQKEEDGGEKQVLAFKLDSKNITELPLPRPHVEIFVYSPRVEAVHLRGGKIARGGLRWSDRHDDFRTEILGLIKAQIVKNAIIVPVGAKGGFVVKNPPLTGGRQAYLDEGIACYKLFIGALLDVTDNIVKGKIVRPKDVVCHDEEDPYLVVAADKGTASFSDIANKISTDRGFWMFDAFASGGSTGYDHKGIGITARGAWEGIKRHFREIGKDIQSEDFTVVGVGDMGGDVFGNGMLLSEHIRLLAAFNHNFIFVDPNPDAAKSFKERKRLFEARGDWDKYDPKVLSKGAAVFDKTAKSLKLTPEIKALFGIKSDSVTPDELMRAVLLHDAELLYFGGIGTYIKSSRQSNADADDKSNDAIRVDGRDIRARVIGEGANLGVTQAGRIEFAMRGGKINTDFIDNSGGVDCSDHEVNLKILLTATMENKKLTLPKRNTLLKSMTEEVADHVLRDNYEQTQSLSVFSAHAKGQLGVHADFMRDLERAGILSRTLEGLPDNDMLVQMAREGRGLTRPELSVLTSYSKIALYNDLLASSLPDDPALKGLLYAYFPRPVHKFTAEIEKHRLRRNIVATVLTNEIVNRMGPVFLSSRIKKAGSDADEVARAYFIIAEAFGMRGFWHAVESLDAKVPGTSQVEAHYEAYQLVKRLCTWLLRSDYAGRPIGDLIALFANGYAAIMKDRALSVSAHMQKTIDQRISRFSDMGLPEDMSRTLGRFVLVASLPDIIVMADRFGLDIKHAARSYFEIGDVLELDWVREEIVALTPANDWQARVISGLLDDAFRLQADILSRIFGARRKKDDTVRIGDWVESNADDIDAIRTLYAEMRQSSAIDTNMLVYLGQRLRQLV